ncbi:MAG: recombinase family protein [Promethearchaeota archaeon]
MPQRERAKEGAEKRRADSGVWAVSSSRQKSTGDLARQLEGLHEYCRKQGFQSVLAYSDIGSGLNDRRKGLRRFLQDAVGGKLDVIVVSYRDRLARFGIQVLWEFFSS